jgi:hypothetical protein
MDAVNKVSPSAPSQQITCLNCHEYNRADKILVDRAQYERMQAFVQRTYESLPNHVNEIAEFYNNMREVCAAYSRGEKP